MSQPIKIKSTSVAGRVPTTLQLLLGELGLNTTDGRLFTKRNRNGAEDVVEIGAEYDHPASGVTAGTYRSVSVDAQGHITGGSNPTTLSGYGIADAAPLAHVSAGGSAHAAASISEDGFMTGTQKTKLDSIAAGANNYVHPDSGVVPGSFSIVTVNAKGHVTGGSQPTTLAGYGITDAAPLSHVGTSGSAHGPATASASGFLSAADKTKLDGLTANAVKYVHPVSGITADTYKSVTVDSNGHITAGSNPTTLAEYGITDAQPASPILTALGGVGTTGMLTHSGRDSFSTVAFAVAGSGLSITNADGVAGNPTIALGTPIVTRDASGAVTANIVTATLSGNASTTSRLAASRTIAASGDATWSMSFDGAGNGTASVALANSGATAGSYGDGANVPSVAVDAKGRVTGISTVALAGGSTTAVGIVQLYDGVNSSSTTLAATASSVKTAYDLASAALPASQKGAASGVATLDSTGKIPAAQLPDYVDDILEVAAFAALPVTGAAGKIYITTDTNQTYRWTGTQYVEVSPTASNSDTATKLTTARSITATGDIGWSINSFDGTGNVTAAGALSTTGVGAGTYRSVTVNAKGRVTAGSNPTTLAGYGITDAQPKNAELTALAAVSTLGLVARTAAGTYATRALAVSGAGLSITGGDGTAVPTIAIASTAANDASTIVARDASGNFSAGTITATLSGNASSASQLTGSATLSMTGDVSWTSGAFNGSGDVTGVATLANSGVTAGTYKSVTVDAKGRVTGGSNPTTLAGYGITDAAKLASPAFTGNPTVPTAILVVGGPSSTQVANIQLMNNAVAQYIDTFGSPMVRQTVQSGRVDSAGYANFLEPSGDPTTISLLHFDQFSANNLDTYDEVYGVSATNYWKGYNTAGMTGGISRFGGASLSVSGLTGYLKQLGVVKSYSTLRAWTEEFWFAMTSPQTANRNMFNAKNASGYGLDLNVLGTNKLQLHLSSTGKSWDLASALNGNTVITANNTWHHIAISFDGATYRVFLDGVPEFVIASPKRLCAITYRTFGDSSNSLSQAYYDEYRLSNYAVYTTGFTPPTAPFTYVTSKKAYVEASNENPLIVSFSNRTTEARITMNSGIQTPDLVPYNKNYVYLTYDKATNTVTQGSTLCPPQYGAMPDCTNHALLTFDNLDPTDPYGNTWLDTAVTYSTQTLSGVTGAVALFDGTSSKLVSDIASLPERWTIRTKVYPTAITTSTTAGTCFFSFRDAAGGIGGIIVRMVSSKLQTYISSTGIVGGADGSVVAATWDIANAATGTTVMTANTWYDIELSFDGASYKLYLNGILQNVWASTSNVLAALGDVRLRIGTNANASNFFKGYVSEFELVPYVKHGDGTTAGQTVFTPQTSKSTFMSSSVHFFDISAMRMTTLSEPSAVPGVVPKFENEVFRVFIGEVELDGSKVTSTTTYALNGRYVSGWYPVATGTAAYRLQHNLGCDLYDIHNYVNTQPREYKKVEECGQIWNYWQSFSSDGYTTTATGNYRSYGTRRVLTATDVRFHVGDYIAVPPHHNTSGYYSTIIARKF